MTSPDTNLRVPGPTPVPAPVAEAGAAPMINHRGPEFAAIMAEVEEGLRPFFGTSGDILLLTGSGTGAQEAAIVNMLSPGDDVLSVTCGVFGDRFADIAETFGACVHRLQVEWGRAAHPTDVAAAVRAHPALKAVLLTHNETSTGVTNDIAALVAAIRDASPDEPPLILVDGVSSIGAIPFEMDAWGVDVAISGSQKAWMSPPGLAMAAIGPRAWQAYAEARAPRYYWNFGKALKNARKGSTPFTPAVGVLYALQEALRLMHGETVPGVFARHRRVADRLRAGLADLNLDLFADPQHVSNTVTAVRVPEGVDASLLLRTLRERCGVVLGSGQDRLKGAIFRVGHLGWVHEEDIDRVLEALQEVLSEVHAPVATGDRT